MRGSNDPLGGNAVLVDKMIGNAYDVVRKVSLVLTEIKYVAYNMPTILAAAQGVTERTALVLGNMTDEPILGLPLPEGATITTVRSSSVCIVADGVIYMPESGAFTAKIQGGSLWVTRNTAQSSLLENGQVRWRVVFGV